MYIIPGFKWISIYINASSVNIKIFLNSLFFTKKNNRFYRFFKNKIIFNNIYYFWIKNCKILYNNDVQKEYYHLYKKLTLFIISMNCVLRQSNINI